MDEKGYIKFNCQWEKSAAYSLPFLKELIEFRNELHKLNLVGCYSNGIGYGNVSLRDTSNKIFITGSATGHIKKLNEEGISQILDYDIDKNYLQCKGPVKASSESLSHVAIYNSLPNVNVVIHVHSLSLWQKYCKVLPTTDPDVEYGTPEMASELIRICKTEEANNTKLLVMGGHKEGLIAFGESSTKAKHTLISYL